VVLSALASSGLGVLVLVGGAVGSVRLVQVRPAFVPMPFNSAISFLFAGIGLFGLARPRRWLAAASGVLAALLGALTLIQFAAGIDTGVDRAGGGGFQTVTVSHPGRMGPNTSLCFTVIGSALLVAAVWPRWGCRAPLLAHAGAVVVALGTATLLGYLGGMRHALSWGHPLRMAIHSAAGFCAIGAGLLVAAWDEADASGTPRPRWVASVVGSGCIAATLWLWRACTAEAHADVLSPGWPFGVLTAGLALAALLTALLYRRRPAF